MENQVDEKRRNFIKGLLTASAIATIAAIVPVGTYISSPSQITETGKYPRIKIANIKDFDKISEQPDGRGMLGKAIPFCYPLTGTTNVLIKAGVPVKNGIGPEKDIIAFSTICQHLGCRVIYYKEINPSNSPKKQKQVLWCPCHQGTYDIENNAEVVYGPPPRRVPRVLLEIDENGDIYAVGMEGPVIKGLGPEGLEGTNLKENLRGGFGAGRLVRDQHDALTCGGK
jgi:arsenite oxidase small subunit